MSAEQSAPFGALDNFTEVNSLGFASKTAVLKHGKPFPVPTKTIGGLLVDRRKEAGPP